MFLGETLKEKQAPRNASKSSSSTNRLRDFKETVSNMIHNRPSLASQTTLGPPCVGKGGEQRREEEGQRGSGHPTRESGAQLLEIATGLLKTGMSYSEF